MEQISLIKKINSLNDVSKALQDLEKVVNGLLASTNTPAEGDVSDIDGKTGDIRITQNEDKDYIYEVRAEDGWKTPVIGDSAVKFKEKPSSSSKKQKKSIDELESTDTTTGSKEAEKTIFDEKADKFVLPRADYDSGWTANASDNAATTLEHSLETVNFSIIDIQISNSSTGSNATWVNAGTNLHDSSDRYKYGYIIQVVDSNNIKVGIAENGAAKFHCDGLEWENTEATHFRLKLWK